MANMLLATGILSDAARLSGNAASGELAIGNLQKQDIQNVYRTISGTAYIVVDLLAARDVNLVAVIGHSGSSRSFARVRAANTESDLTANPGYDSGDQPFRSHQSGYDATWANSVADEEYGAMEKNLFRNFFTVRTYRFWRIDITDPNASYIDMGRLYVSHAWQPDVNMDYGLNEGIVDPSRKVRTVGGKVIPVERKKWRFAEFNLGYASKSEIFGRAYAIELMQGRTRDVLFIVDPDETDFLQYRSIYGTMENQPITHPVFNLFSKTFRIEEIPA